MIRKSSLSFPTPIKRKGVSPFIAAILLLAITVAVATIVGNWFKDYATRTAEETAESNDVNCLNVGVNIDLPRYNTSTNVSSFLVENSGTVNFNVDKLSLLYEYSNGSVGKDLRDISNRQVVVGDSTGISLTNVQNEFSQIKVILTPCADKSITIDYAEFSVS